jgi:ATP-dependent protease ClpP protease subunit
MKDSLDTIYVKPTPSEYVYHIDSEVGEPHNYRELIQALESMQEGDHLSLYINTFGGYLHTTIALLGHLRATKGHVHTVLNGVACSAGSILFLSGHSCEVMPHSTLMAHTSSGGNGYEKLSDSAKRLAHDTKHLSKLYHEVYEYFMSKEEIEQMLAGVDFWFDDEDLDKRLTYRAEKIQAKQQEMMKQVEQDFLASMEADELPETILKKLTKLQLIAYIQGDIIVDVKEDGETFEIIEIEDEEPPKLH